MWHIHIVTDKQLRQFYQLAWDEALAKGFKLGVAYGQNKGIITGRPLTKVETEIAEIQKRVSNENSN